ncbi:Dam family site-specific DNA-(adenine-N6)-methyltransferase [Mammaliicoccus vitulinus]|uniref:Dam family site-specific DNA-(adenine-N6)-methyltransferase n=1 Tax=Mammaliicoccus vitulinus TaxID=71237 RepID=UPI002DBC2F4B|nr:Dam family site-specific DNA-(adenine-N6)-methyltransferase [Mammaliicoccus vitulinus]MEB7657956.1 Dam family site-specific DNA-(adenine-N6)-methyltransferase [Mammaliicoccus vitulinus]
MRNLRYLGNKTQLLNFIENTMNKFNIEGNIFADLFAGTGAVGDYFKNKYEIISNDYMYFSSVINKAKLYNNDEPKFENFKKIFKCSPFAWLNNRDYEIQENYFVYHNYSLPANRMYFTPENAVKIDGIRIDIEELYVKGIIDKKEYYFLLASLLESVVKISNTTGTYQAFLKYWESRSLKPLIIKPVQINYALTVDTNNTVYNENTNKLVRKLEGDIAYIDPPYTITQYANSYHVLETIAKYDFPDIFGITGRRKNREFSGYSNKSKAIYEFEDLLRQINFEHILISYSNHSIIPLEELVNISKHFAIENEVHVEFYDYRSYATNNRSYKEKESPLKEVLIYFKKDRKIKKSPLNYSGSKDKVLPAIINALPKRVDSFIDCMGGAFNVGLNIAATNQVIYNEINPFIHDMIKYLLDEDKENILNDIEKTINHFKLKKKDKESYNLFRTYYNENKSPLLLYVLHIYSFQNMIRFNSKLDMNVPIGNNEYNAGTKLRINEFKPKTNKVKLLNTSYLQIKPENFSLDSVFYFDPPYFITKAEYNDGKRGLEGWNIDEETKLLEYLVYLNKNGYKFMLSNILYHGNKEHHVLIEWIKEHDFRVIEVGKTGIKYPRLEVLIVNY